MANKPGGLDDAPAPAVVARLSPCGDRGNILACEFLGLPGPGGADNPGDNPIINVWHLLKGSYFNGNQDRRGSPFGPLGLLTEVKSPNPIGRSRGPILAASPPDPMQNRPEAFRESRPFPEGVFRRTAKTFPPHHRELSLRNFFLRWILTGAWGINRFKDLECNTFRVSRTGIWSRSFNRPSSCTARREIDCLHGVRLLLLNGSCLFEKWFDLFSVDHYPFTHVRDLTGRERVTGWWTSPDKDIAILERLRSLQGNPRGRRVGAFCLVAFMVSHLKKERIWHTPRK